MRVDRVVTEGRVVRGDVYGARDEGREGEMGSGRHLPLGRGSREEVRGARKEGI